MCKHSAKRCKIADFEKVMRLTNGMWGNRTGGTGNVSASALANFMNQTFTNLS